VQASSSVSAPPDVARDLGLFLKQVLGSSSREFFAALQEAGISFTQLKCLGRLSEADGALSLGGLSEQLGLSLAATSRAVDALVQRGEIKREEDPGDRRSKLVTLSSRGRATHERILAVRLAGVRRFVESLEPAESEALGAALRPIVERLGR
jgi:DNA-binding MarR family transcriptional regulator